MHYAWDRLKMHTKFWCENLMERDLLKNVGEHRSVILK